MRLFEMHRVKRSKFEPRRRRRRPALNLTLPYSTKENFADLCTSDDSRVGFRPSIGVSRTVRRITPRFGRTTPRARIEVFDRAANDRHPWYFEPYVVLRADEAIDFDESFVAYGFNKIAWITELAAIGFEFHSTRNAGGSCIRTPRSNMATGASRGQRLSKVSRAPGVFDRFSTRAHRTLVHSGVFTSTGVRVRILSRRERMLDSVDVQNDVRFRLERDDNIVCFAGCLTDLEDATRTPSAVTIRGGRFVDVAPGSDARRRKRGLCQRFVVETGVKITRQA